MLHIAFFADLKHLSFVSSVSKDARFAVLVFGGRRQRVERDRLGAADDSDNNEVPAETEAARGNPELCHEPSQ